MELKRETLDLMNKIGNLKTKLARTDYQAIKFAEGELTAEEYVETKAMRKAWREEINQLQAQLKIIDMK